MLLIVFNSKQYHKEEEVDQILTKIPEL